jgi:hypothetical protein
MVAMMVALVGLMGIAQLFAVSLRMQQLGRNTGSAIRIAQEKVDELSTLSFATAAAVQCGGSLTADVANYNDTPPTFSDYKRRWIVSAGPDGALTLRQVTVRVIPQVVTRSGASVVNDRSRATQFDLTTVIRGVSAPCP